MTRSCSPDNGFTVVELMVVVGIIAILVVMAVPLYVSARVRTAENTCFGNQRALEGATGVWTSIGPDRDVAELAGVVNASHPLVIENIVGRIPRCPSAGGVADSRNPTAAEGAYTFDTGGTLEPCVFGELGAHGHY